MRFSSLFLFTSTLIAVSVTSFAQAPTPTWVWRYNALTTIFTTPDVTVAQPAETGSTYTIVVTAATQAQAQGLSYVLQSTDGNQTGIAVQWQGAAAQPNAFTTGDFKTFVASQIKAAFAGNPYFMDSCVMNIDGETPNTVFAYFKPGQTSDADDAKTYFQAFQAVSQTRFFSAPGAFPVDVAFTSPSDADGNPIADPCPSK